MLKISRRSFVASAPAALVAMHAGLRAAPSQGEMRDDVAIVRMAMELHPGVFRYQSRGDLDRSLARLEKDFVGSQSQEQRFLILSAFMASIRCGHSQCNPFNQRKGVISSLFERSTRVPFEFMWIDGRMIVLADRSGTSLLRPGTEILRINDEPSSHLLGRLLRYARADGHNDAKRVAQMGMRNTDRFETFDIYQGLLNPPRGGGFYLEYRSPEGRIRRGQFEPLSAARRLAARRTIETDGTAEPFWNWEMDGGVALLTMPSWVMYNSKWDWQSWLDERLGSLIGARGLIIDLRDNEGGNECGNVLLSRLAGKDLDFAGYRQLVRYRHTPSDIDRYLDTWDDSFRSIGEKGADAGNGFYELGKEETDRIVAVGPRIDLPVAALVGPTCSSATFSFARRAQESGLIKLFGEPTGGNLRGINGNGYFFVRLPGSGLEFDLPIIGNFPVIEPQPDRGILPDFSIKATIADIAQGHDPCLDAARKWIGAQAS